VEVSQGLPASDLEVRRRRAAWRASHRGTKEMDWLLGKYVLAKLAEADGEALAALERLIEMPDPDLHQWIFYPGTLTRSEFAELIADLRRFHQLEPRSSENT
jgi:antitoxin CptB